MSVLCTWELQELFLLLLLCPQIPELLINLMNDPSVQVRDSVAWTIGRVCEHIPSAVLNDQYVLKLLEGLCAGLLGEPRVATNVCWVSRHTELSQS